MREEAEVQAGIHNYLLPPSLKLCCAISYGLFWERRPEMTGTLLPLPRSREARQAHLKVGELFPASFQLRKRGQCHEEL